MIQETEAAMFLDRFGFYDSCKECGDKVWIMFNKKRQPIMINVELKEHHHNKTKQQTVKKLIAQERRATGGEQW